jgi:hypothetical protein
VPGPVDPFACVGVVPFLLGLEERQIVAEHRPQDKPWFMNPVVHHLYHSLNIGGRLAGGGVRRSVAHAPIPGSCALQLTLARCGPPHLSTNRASANLLRTDRPM